MEEEAAMLEDAKQDIGKMETIVHNATILKDAHVQVLIL